MGKRQTHSGWSNVATPSELPNVSGAAVQSASLLVGETCYSVSDDILYTCTDATGEAAVWSGDLIDPTSTAGDIIVKNGSNVTAALSPGSEGKVLTSHGTAALTWETPAANVGFADPMAAAGDIIYRTSGNATDNLSSGAQGTVLTSDGTNISWVAPATNVGFADPMAAIGDTIVRNISNVTDALSPGTSDQVLTAHGVGAALTWETPAAGFADPMAAAGDIIYRTSGNATDNLSSGAQGTVLTSDGTNISWVAPATFVSQWTEGSTIYVNKDGSDGNDGLSINLAKLTITSAIAAASAASLTDPFTICVYPGIYEEQIALPYDYVSLIGIGGPKAVVVEYDTDAQYVLLMNAGEHNTVEGIHFRGITAATVDALRFINSTLDFTFRDCIFTSFGTGRAEVYGSTVGNNALVTGVFYDCVFTSGSLDGAMDPSSLAVDDSTVEFHGCRIEGGVVAQDALAQFYGCVMRGATNADGKGVALLSLPIEFYDCDVENTGAGSGIIVGEAGVVIHGGRAWAGSNSTAKSVNAGTIFAVRGKGTVMNKGFSATIYRSDFVGNVGASGDVDFHLDLNDACDALSGDSGIIYLHKDYEITSTISELSESITIDGQSAYNLTPSPTTLTMFSQASNAQMLTLQNMGITDGVIAWDTAYAGILRLIEVGGGVHITTALNASEKEIILDSCNIEVATTDTDFLDIGHADTAIQILRSRIKGNGSSHYAIQLTVDNENIQISNSEILAGGTGSPIDPPATTMDIASHHNYYNADPFSNSDLNNTIDPAYDAEISYVAAEGGATANTVSTTDATETTLATITTTNDEAQHITATIVARQTNSANETNTYILDFSIKDNGGTVTVGTVQNTYTDEDEAGWSVTAEAVTTDHVEILVTGAASDSIDWKSTHVATVV